MAKFKKLEKKKRYGDKYVITVDIEVRSMFQAPTIVKRDIFVDPGDRFFQVRWMDTGHYVAHSEYADTDALVAFAKSSETVLEIN